MSAPSWQPEVDQIYWCENMEGHKLDDDKESFGKENRGSRGALTFSMPEAIFTVTGDGIFDSW
jgi:hypothetical protein